MTRFKTYGKSRSLRLEGIDYSAPFVYHVSFSRHRTADIVLNEPPVGEVIVASVRDISGRLGFEVFAFCVMPDHVHILCQPANNDSSLSSFVGRVKGRASRELGAQGARKPLWQRGFYDQVLRKEEDVWEVARPPTRPSP